MTKKVKVSQPGLFGGSWTPEKLRCLQNYLKAYCQIFKKGSRGAYFETTYVDAFAGTGYLEVQDLEMPLAQFFPVEFEGLARSAAEYAKGSAVRALEVEPGFDKFLFIERDADRAAELGRLMEQFPGKNIQIVNSDANSALTDWINATEWLQNRAVVFLDPFGMQVEWKLIESLARTQAIDLWILFPLFAVNRMLVRHGEPPEGWRTKLTKVFGTSDWEPAFYTRTKSLIIEGLEITEKSADIGRISEFFLSQLKRLFPAVARPLVLTNSRGAPLFLFCFAAANKKGAPTALRIAEHVIGHS